MAPNTPNDAPWEEMNGSSMTITPKKHYDNAAPLPSANLVAQHRNGEDHYEGRCGEVFITIASIGVE